MELKVNRMEKFIVKTKDYSFIATADNTNEAFAQFFADFINKDIPIDKIGNIVKIVLKDDEIAFRTIPTLVLLGKLSVSDGIVNIKELLNIDTLEAIKVLEHCMETDKWIVPLIAKFF